MDCTKATSSKCSSIFGDRHRFKFTALYRFTGPDHRDHRIVRSRDGTIFAVGLSADVTISHTPRVTIHVPLRHTTYQHVAYGHDQRPARGDRSEHDTPNRGNHPGRLRLGLTYWSRPMRRFKLRLRRTD